jgi:glycosyltransferase involved in cell wall biosynthesis
VLCADILKNRFQPYPNCPPIEVVYDMVDVNKFKPCVNKELKRKSLGITSDKLTIGFVGNYVPRKRPEWIIRATNQLIKEGLSVQLILIGVDYSNGSYGKLLSKMAKDEGNHSDIHLVGYQSNVNEWMQAMDIFTLTSVAKGEAFPFTIIEAMSTGVPVVSTNVAGVPESVVHQETGLLSSTESYDDFYGNLKYLCQNKELRLKLGRSSRERVIEQFSIESLDKKIKKDMVSFYRQLLHNGK